MGASQTIKATVRTIDDGRWTTQSTIQGPDSTADPGSRLSPIVRSHPAALLSLAVLTLLYLAAFLALPPQALTHHDEGAKYLQVRNLRLTPSGLDWSINYPARRLDPEVEFAPFHPKQHVVDGQGRIYLQWPIFLGLATRIFWKVAGFPGLYVVPLLAGLGTLWAAYLLALAAGVAKRVAWLAVPLLGLATPISLYSLLYFEHTLAALLVTLSLLAAVIALRQPSPSRRALAASGALLAFAVYFRSELYILALVLGLALLAWGRRQQSWRAPLIWGGAFALVLVPLWAFYAISEGTLLPTHALWYFAGRESSNPGGVPQPGLPPLRYIASAGWGVVPAFLLGPRDAPLSPGYPLWSEVAALAGVALCIFAALGRLLRQSASRSGWRVLLLTSGLALVALACLAVLLSPQPYFNLHGFLLAAPFVALALWPDRDEAGGASPPSRLLYAVALSHVGLHALIISAFSGLGPISVHEWGQRYLLPAYPLLVVLALLALSHILGSVRQAKPASAVACATVSALLALVGLGFTIRGYAVLSEERAQVTGWLALVRTLPEREPLVTDVWWLPLNLAADFYSRPIMLAEGDARLSDWANRMRERGVSQFGLATDDPSTLTGAWVRAVPGLIAGGPLRHERGIWLQEYRLRP
jgi:hypothetical protein